VYNNTSFAGCASFCANTTRCSSFQLVRSTGECYLYGGQPHAIQGDADTDSAALSSFLASPKVPSIPEVATFTNPNSTARSNISVAHYYGDTYVGTTSVAPNAIIPNGAFTTCVYMCMAIPQCSSFLFFDRTSFNASLNECAFFSGLATYQGSDFYTDSGIFLGEYNNSSTTVMTSKATVVTVQVSASTALSAITGASSFNGRTGQKSLAVLGTPASPPTTSQYITVPNSNSASTTFSKMPASGMAGTTLPSLLGSSALSSYIGITNGGGSLTVSPEIPTTVADLGSLTASMPMTNGASASPTSPPSIFSSSGAYGSATFGLSSVALGSILPTSTSGYADANSGTSFTTTGSNVNLGSPSSSNGSIASVNSTGSQLTVPGTSMSVSATFFLSTPPSTSPSAFTNGTGATTSSGAGAVSISSSVTAGQTNSQIQPSATIGSGAGVQSSAVATSSMSQTLAVGSGVANGSTSTTGSNGASQTMSSSNNANSVITSVATPLANSSGGQLTSPSSTTASALSSSFSSTIVAASSAATQQSAITTSFPSLVSSSLVAYASATSPSSAAGSVGPTQWPQSLSEASSSSSPPTAASITSIVTSPQENSAISSTLSSFSSSSPQEAIIRGSNSATSSSGGSSSSYIASLAVATSASLYNSASSTSATASSSVTTTVDPRSCPVQTDPYSAGGSQYHPLCGQLLLSGDVLSQEGSYTRGYTGCASDCSGNSACTFFSYQSTSNNALGTPNCELYAGNPVNWGTYQDTDSGILLQSTPSSTTTATSSTSSVDPVATDSCAAQGASFTVANGKIFNTRCGQIYVGTTQINNGAYMFQAPYNQDYRACADLCNAFVGCSSFLLQRGVSCGLWKGPPPTVGNYLADYDSGIWDQCDQASRALC
jgi:hypothetical protein